MKALKKLIPAVAMLLLCAVMMTTATFAWFSMNESVAVDTGTTKVTAPTNIQIAKWTKTGTPAAYVLGDYSEKVDFSSPADTVPILPATVKNESGTLKWQTTDKAGNDGTAIGTLTNLTLDADGKAGDKQYFKKFEMNIKNNGGTTIDVKLDPTAIAVAAKEAAGITKSSDLYKSVCFMVFVGTAGTTAPTDTTVGTLPVVVWDDASDTMQATTTLITGTVTSTTKFVTLSAKQNVNITVVAWMEGNKKSCANTNVNSNALAFGLTLGLKAEAATV